MTGRGRRSARRRRRQPVRRPVPCPRGAARRRGRVVGAARRRTPCSGDTPRGRRAELLESPTTAISCGGARWRSSAQRRCPTAAGARSSERVREPEHTDRLPLELGISVDRARGGAGRTPPSSCRTAWGGRRTPCAGRRGRRPRAVDVEAAARASPNSSTQRAAASRRASSSQRSSPVADVSSTRPFATFA